MHSHKFYVKKDTQIQFHLQVWSWTCLINLLSNQLLKRQCFPHEVRSGKVEEEGSFNEHRPKA